MSHTYDMQQAQTMMSMLAPEGGGFTFQTFDDDADRSKKALTKQFHGSLETHSASLSKLNGEGAGVFVTVNATDGLGRRKGNITAVRALFVDFDTADPERFNRLLIEPLPPNLIVESSIGKHHAYWIADGIALDDFTRWQKFLIEYFKSTGDAPDGSVHDLPRVMRLAGFDHRKVNSKKGLTGDAFSTRIVHQGQRYSIEDIEQLIDSLPAQLTAKLTSKNINTKILSTPILPQATDNSQLPQLDAEQVRALARGRWEDILGRLDYHVTPDTNQHSACPVCGGTDRFRFDNKNGTGSFICSQGTGRTVAGDGLSLLADHAELGIPDSLNAVTAVLNDMGLISPYDGKTYPQYIEWGVPEPLANDPSQPTPYPIDAWKGLLRQVIEAVAYYAQVTLTMAAKCVLGALAHIGQQFIDAPFGHGHKPASLIIIIEGESGTGKTETMNLTHFRINEYEKQRYEEYLASDATWEADKESLKGKELKEFLDNTPEPKNPKSVFDDATIEHILDKFVTGEMLNASWTTDEAAQFFNGHTMKGDTAGNALGAITKLYSGGHVSRSRSEKTAKGTPFTDAYDARMTLLLQGQRTILEPALSNPLMNGQGFLARALIACPEDLRGYRKWDDPERRHNDPYNNPYLIEYWSRCESLLNPSPANEPIDTRGKPRRIKMQWADDKAEQVFYEKLQSIENRQRQGGIFATVKAYASRMAENASRIASLMAFFDERATITTDDITRAYMLVEYSTAERLRYLDSTPTDEQNDSEKLSSWLVEKAKDKNPHKLNRTDIYNGAPKPMRKNNRILQAELDNLESKLHIRQTEEGRKKVIEINPNLYK